MPSLIASGITPDGMFGGYIQLFVFLGGVVLWSIDRRSGTKKRRVAERESQRRIEELSDRLDRKSETQLSRVTRIYEAQLVEHRGTIVDLRRQLDECWKRRSVEGG